ncbi:unnamed protein product [Porites evermanni]|uniref:Uncharacterized protein n=1 Tax=Porites evermanni TaxID=104178 RepID=A0ABN8LYL0_9CNID|nr:unnamed protein product [Porites evermanni]
MALSCLSCFAASNLILLITGGLSLPLYFSYFGSEAATRFSLLLCLHSVLLAAIPRVLKSALPMLQLLLFVTLLLLPFNVTPHFIVWSYQKILRLSESAFLLTEAVLSVLVVMFVSQSIVNEIDEHPVLVKSSILTISGVAYFLSMFLGYNLFADIHTTDMETWVGGFAVVLSLLVFFICLRKEEGIISDAAVISLVMMFISWAIKQERLMQENSLDAPTQWLYSFTGNRSFLSLFLSMATASLEHMSRAQRIISIFLSPTCLLFALVRVASVLALVAAVQLSYSQKDEECSTLYEEEPRIYGGFRPLYLRLIIIFVYTEVVVRTIDSATSFNAHDIANRSSNRDVLPMLTGIKVWRIIQLLTITITYLYQLFKQAD